MPVFIDILENQVLGREYKKGLAEGRAEGELKIVHRQLEARFGPLPPWAEERLAKRSPAELEDLSVAILSAGTLEELLKQKP